MTTILQKIIEHKKVEVAKQKQLVPIDALLVKKRTRPHYSLKESLLADNASGIIAEFKRKSPSKNWINQQAVSTQIVPAYEQAGASGFSILTDTVFFGGNNHDLTSAAELVTKPILRKDFIVDEYQIIEANRMGADVILLIAANLTPAEVKHLANIAQQQNLEVLLEIHNEQELKHICDAITIVGVNNRNLHNFTTNLETSVELSKLIPEQFVKISESGITSANDIKFLKQHGFRGFLIGESFMKTDDAGQACAKFISEL